LHGSEGLFKNISFPPFFGGLFGGIQFWKLPEEKENLQNF
jgi:hypothetical protein